MAKLYFKYGTMGSGKTHELIRVCYNYSERGMNVITLKPCLDTRDGTNECIIKSRTGSQVKADWINLDDNIFKIIKCYIDKFKLDAILIDEVQFLTEKQIEQLQQIVIELDIPVICYGLKTNFKGYLFPAITRLLALCDSAEEIKSLCHCGKLAKQNARVINGQIVTDGEIVVMGGNDKYISLCNKCYYEKNLGDIKNNKIKKYEIWREGYSCTGLHDTARIFGTQEGNSFKEACIKFFSEYDDGNLCFDSNRMSYWGCKLFDNETDARRHFG
ncbi:thymidine kinase [Clostridium botulinum]|uniref:thymidine kinase n=1 Tax=Clostridium botulinum TaxID=1491 RepID=UPI001C9B6BAA|nr:thymidine kinase [Clostridium botulinum]MBY6838690.1 thymidine kinase [Clostridium botulinum]